MLRDVVKLAGGDCRGTKGNEVVGMAQWARTSNLYISVVTSSLSLTPRPEKRVPPVANKALSLAAWWSCQV